MTHQPPLVETDELAPWWWAYDPRTGERGSAASASSRSYLYRLRRWPDARSARLFSEPVDRP